MNTDKMQEDIDKQYDKVEKLAGKKAMVEIGVLIDMEIELEKECNI